MIQENRLIRGNNSWMKEELLVVKESLEWA